MAWFERRRPNERRGLGAFFNLDVVDETLLRHVVGIDSEGEREVFLCNFECGGDTRPFGVLQFDGCAMSPTVAAAIPDEAWIRRFYIE